MGLWLIYTGKKHSVNCEKLAAGAKFQATLWSLVEILKHRRRDTVVRLEVKAPKSIDFH